MREGEIERSRRGDRDETYNVDQIGRRDREIGSTLWEVETFFHIAPHLMPTHPLYDNIMQTLPHNVDAGKVYSFSPLSCSPSLLISSSLFSPLCFSSLFFSSVLLTLV